jgi:hypothetical protein
MISSEREQCSQRGIPRNESHPLAKAQTQVRPLLITIFDVFPMRLTRASKEAATPPTGAYSA